VGRYVACYSRMWQLIAPVLLVDLPDFFASSRVSEGAANSAVLPDPPLTVFEQTCASQYAQDPWFSDPVNSITFTRHQDLFFQGTRLVVPDGSGLREVCFAHAHSSAYAGHPGHLNFKVA
jgi:hypothetical protein